MRDNIVTAVYNGTGRYKTAPLYQYDYGQKLVISGAELPSAYEVHFANTVHGNATTQIGDSTGVTIPDMYLLSGQTVYAWLFIHSGEADGETEFIVTIPVIARAKPTDVPPTPVQQSAITEAIIALNQALYEASVTVSHYPQVINGYWHTWDVDDGEWVSTGVQAQGPAGADGQDGDDGADGYSPTAIVIRPTGQRKTYIMITDKNGTTGAVIADGSDGAPGQDGQDGQDGVSPTITSSEITGGHRLTITDVNGTSTVDVMDGTDGQDGAPGVGVPSGGTDGQMLVKDGATDYATKWVNQPTVPVTDVQVDGTSILNQGVANVPKAGVNTEGVVKLLNNAGLRLDSDGYLRINATTSAKIKQGTDYDCPVVPEKQHESTFYGLAKAAGDTSQPSSSNAVGTYTEDALVKIQKMLGIYKPPYRLIKEITISEETAYVYVTKDDDLEDFSLTDAVIETVDLVSTNNGALAISVNSGSTGGGAPQNGPFIAINTGCSTSGANTVAKLRTDGGRFFGEAPHTTMPSYYSPAYVYINKNAWGTIECGKITEFFIKSMNSYKFTSGKIKIYGR